MDHLPLVAAAAAVAPAPAAGAQQGGVLDAYKKALATAASVAAYAVLARSMSRELLPDELRAVARWGAALVRARVGAAEKERHTVVIRRQLDGGYGENQMFEAARAYLATKIDPRALRRLSLARSRCIDADGRSSWTTLLCLEPGDSTTDVFDGVEFRWTSMEAGGGDDGKRGGKGGDRGHRAPRERESFSLELSFDAEHTDTALERYIPFVMATAEELQRRERALRIFMNEERSWHGFNHHPPGDSIVDDLDRFLKRKEYYRRIGKAWKRGYLLHGPPGTGKSSLVAAMANYLRFNLYDLDLSQVHVNSNLQRLLISMPNKSILVIEDIDCCFDANPREDHKTTTAAALDQAEDFDFSDDGGGAPPRAGDLQQQNVTLSGLLNFIDGLWSTSGEERVIVFTTNYKDRLDPALLRPGRMDMHVYMGYCGWEAFKTLARNYFLVGDHPLFPEVRELLAGVEATPAEVSEMLLRSEDVDVALRLLTEELRERTRRRARQEAAIENELTSSLVVLPSAALSTGATLPPATGCHLKRKKKRNEKEKKRIGGEKKGVTRMASMDHHRLPLAAAGASESERGRAASAYRKALATAASVAAYSVMARDLLPDELRAAVRRAARLVWARLFAAAAAAAAAEKKKKRRTLVIRRRYADGDTNMLFRSARE
uniref:AAA+ ATPase domain-containing protein n=1 Tax=Oryza meridionalis TaxID=40149 RepID=A0A0E0EC39_9ORYZ